MGMVSYVHVVYVTCYVCYMFSLGSSSGSIDSVRIYRSCQVTVHYVPNIDLIIFLLSGRTFSRVTDKPLNKLRVIWNYVKGCVVITSHVVFIYLKNNQ